MNKIGFFAKRVIKEEMFMTTVGVIRKINNNTLVI